jgi:hypothetical protein
MSGERQVQGVRVVVVGRWLRHPDRILERRLGRLHVVLGSDGVVPAAQDAFVDPGEMRDIQEVFDRPPGRGRPNPLVSEERPVARIIEEPVREGRERRHGVGQIHPHHPVRLGRLVRGCASLGRDRRARRQRRDLDAGAGAVVLPAVVGTGDVAILHPPQRERGSPVDANVFESGHPRVDPEQCQILVEELKLLGLGGDVFRPGKRVPVVAKAGNHGSTLS